jgi:hypothetical protein
MQMGTTWAHATRCAQLHASCFSTMQQAMPSAACSPSRRVLSRAGKGGGGLAAVHEGGEDEEYNPDDFIIGDEDVAAGDGGVTAAAATAGKGGAGEQLGRRGSLGNTSSIHSPAAAGSHKTTAAGSGSTGRGRQSAPAADVAAVGGSGANVEDELEDLAPVVSRPEASSPAAAIQPGTQVGVSSLSAT